MKKVNDMHWFYRAPFISPNIRVILKIINAYLYTYCYYNKRMNKVKYGQ